MFKFSVKNAKKLRKFRNYKETFSPWNTKNLIWKKFNFFFRPKLADQNSQTPPSSRISHFLVSDIGIFSHFSAYFLPTNRIIIFQIRELHVHSGQDEYHSRQGQRHRDGKLPEKHDLGRGQHWIRRIRPYIWPYFKIFCGWVPLSFSKESCVLRNPSHILNIFDHCSDDLHIRSSGWIRWLLFSSFHIRGRHHHLARRSGAFIRIFFYAPFIFPEKNFTLLMIWWISIQIH